MPSTKWSKKTEKIEVRLPPETKSDFLETCKQRGESASSVIRGFVDNYIQQLYVEKWRSPTELVRNLPWWSKFGSIGAIVAAIFAVVVLPTQAMSEIPWKNRFESKDRDNNGVIEPAELIVALSPDLAEQFSDSEVRKQERGMTTANYREFLEMDGNGDFKVSKSEFRAYLIEKETEVFQSFDLNSDGYLDFEELLLPVGEKAKSRRTMLIGFSHSRFGFGSRSKAGSSRNDCFKPWLDSDVKNTWNLAPVFATMDNDGNCRVTLTEFASF
ncbi:MAG: hypothetical protein HRT80_05930 [Henriciella sp.]|nr:hypothetical protein [Henriciella sp.]